MGICGLGLMKTRLTDLPSGFLTPETLISSHLQRPYFSHTYPRHHHHHHRTSPLPIPVLSATRTPRNPNTNMHAATLPQKTPLALAFLYKSGEMPKRNESVSKIRTPSQHPYTSNVLRTLCTDIILDFIPRPNPSCTRCLPRFYYRELCIYHSVGLGFQNHRSRSLR